MLGGRIADIDAYELGYEQIKCVGEDQLLKRISEAFRNFETHSDRAVELPAGAATLACNDYGVHAFHTGSTYGVQANPKLV